MTPTSATGRSNSGCSGGGCTYPRANGLFSGGFTLIELMVVLFVISVLMAVVLPSFSSTGSSLKAEARGIASTFRYLNETSALKKQALHMKFDLDEKTMAWAETPGSEAEKSRRIEDLKAVELQTKGAVSEGEVIVFFSPLGVREHVRVMLEKDGQGMSVTLNPISGRVKILGDDEK